MSAPMTSGKSDHWGSRFGFIMAAVGSSVGLGNLWRFPFTAGENGGSAFILIYLFCVLLFGLPVLIAEYAVGRHGGRSAIAGVRYITERENKSSAWISLAWIGAFASLLIFSFYVVIAAWVFDYIPQAFFGKFSGFAADTDLLNASIGATAESLKDQIGSIKLDSTCAFVDESGVITQLKDADGNLRALNEGDVSGCKFGQTTSNKMEMLLYFSGFLILNVFIVSRGIKGGIEKAAEILMPAFFVMLLGMVAFALIQGDAAKTASFLFNPDFTKVNLATVLAALGQAFFSLSVGSALMVTYGAYLTRDTNIPKSSAMVAGTDTFVALIAGFAIFPIVFQAGLDPAGGGGLFFETMPVAFGKLPSIVGGLFFTLALFAAFTSSISLFEVGVSWLEDQRSIGRVKGAIGLGLIMFVLGVCYIYRGDLIDHADFLTGQVLLPLGGVLIALFAGWVLPKHVLAEEIGEGAHLAIVRVLLRYLVPIALSVILVLGTIATLHKNYGMPLDRGIAEMLGVASEEAPPEDVEPAEEDDVTAAE